SLGTHAARATIASRQAAIGTPPVQSTRACLVVPAVALLESLRALLAAPPGAQVIEVPCFPEHRCIDASLRSRVRRPTQARGALAYMVGQGLGGVEVRPDIDKASEASRRMDGVTPPLRRAARSKAGSAPALRTSCRHAPRGRRGQHQHGARSL